MTYEHLLKRIWGAKSDGDVRPMRTVVSSLRRKLGDDADNPTYIFTEPRVGYRMPKGRRGWRRRNRPRPHEPLFPTLYKGVRCRTPTSPSSPALSATRAGMSPGVYLTRASVSGH